MTIEVGDLVVNLNLSRHLWTIGMVLSLGVALVSYRYLVPHMPIPSDIGKNLMRRPWLFVHAGLAATALFLGPWQFLPGVRRRTPRVHRWIGRIYVFACLVGGCAGLLLARGTDAGPIAQAGFGILAIVWVGITTQALRLALARRFVEHRRWMIRSFALTFAAVTLRIYLPAAQIMGLDFMESYRAISWLAWVPNLLLAELYLRRANSKSPVAFPA